MLAGGTLHEMSKGIDPRDKPKQAVELNLRATLEAYLAARKDLRPASIAGYRLSIERYLANWLTLPLRAITADMVEERRRAIVEEVVESSQRGGATGKSTANGTMRAFPTLWNFATERDATLPSNPVRRLRRQWYAEPRREGHVSADAMPRFYEAVLKLPNAVARDYILLLLFTATDTVLVSRRMATRKGAEMMRGWVIKDSAIEIDKAQLENGNKWTERGCAGRVNIGFPTKVPV